jgi:hypothetical protein
VRVRDFFPKGTDFNLVNKEKLNWVQNTLKERPRQSLEFNSPKETFNSLLLKQLFLREKLETTKYKTPNQFLLKKIALIT